MPGKEQRRREVIVLSRLYPLQTPRGGQRPEFLVRGLDGSGLCQGLLPAAPGFPEEAAARECSGRRVSAQAGPADSGPGPRGREGGQPDPPLGGGGQEPGSVTPHLGQIYRLSKGPVVAGDLISLGRRGGQEKKAAWGQLLPWENPGASLGHTGWSRPAFAWDKSRHAMV